MTVEGWDRVKELLHQALQLAPDQRARFLDEACSSDGALRAEVESLLLADEGIGSSFMQSPPLADELRADGIGASFALEAGQVFAQRFQLVRKLGEGGMGQVWLAEQTSPVRRQVALKLIKAGMYDESVVQRFRAERQSLAIMDHPAIAKVFDAGATPQGQPYFVMEYVPGLPIAEYCDRKKLKIRDRLELFIQVCDGVQNAHQKAIIHRDLKPANILVIEVDGKPVAWIIDFGLAKATTPQVEGESLFTQLGHFVGTPGYMSPEQADPNVRDVDTRTDVYSLGVVLYVLLAGLQPFETRQRQKQPLDEWLRKLREEEPPRPSAKVSTDRETSSSTAEARGTNPSQLVSLLRGDLDWITMKALEKNRARRYGTPSELAADIRRYLNHEPVVARPARAGYRLRKYARRHRVAVAVAGGLVLLLAAFSVLQALQLRRITRERDRATRITDFMTGMFKVSDPSEARGNGVTAREILDKASTDMQKGLAKDPEVQSQMTQVMASTYTNLGLYPRAHELAKRALDARLSLLGPDDPKTLESMAQLGWILNREGHYVEAEKTERQALMSERRVLGPEDPLTIETMGNLAFIVQGPGDFGQGEKLAREVIEVATRRLGPESAPVLQAMNHLGDALWNQGRYAEAERDFRQLLDVERRVLGPDHPETLRAMASLALTIQSQRRFAEAEQVYREAMGIAQRVLGPEHPLTTGTMFNLAALLSLEGHHADAEKLYRETLAIQLRTLGPDHPRTLLSKAALADELFKEGHVSEAEKLQRKTVETMVRVLGPEHPSTLVCQSSLAKDLIREGRYAEAEKIAREAFDAAIRTLGPQHPYTLDTLQQLGTAMAYTHRYAEASKLFRDVIEKQDSSKGQGDRFSVWYSFACVAVAANQPDDALQYLREAIKRGYKDTDGLMADDSLKNLRHNPHFQEIIDELRHHSASGNATRKELVAIVAKSRELGYQGIEPDAPLALSEIEMKAGQITAGRAHLAAIEADAKAKGYDPSARKAASARD
jgi:non-specific serine/threonine protein kinase/serine/threonine-protein kinase